MHVGKSHLGIGEGMQKRQEEKRVNLRELSVSQGHLTLLSIFRHMFYLEAILSYLVPHYWGS